MAGAGDWGRSMNLLGKALGWWVLGGEREGRSAVGRMLRGDAEGWSVEQGALGRGQEVTRVRVCIIRGSLPRVYTLLVFDVVQIARLARACDAPHSRSREEESERNEKRNEKCGWDKTRAGPLAPG